jgi:hypothetical protein
LQKNNIYPFPIFLTLLYYSGKMFSMFHKNEFSRKFSVTIKFTYIVLFFCLFSPVTIWSQKNSIFSRAGVTQTMSERWELDSATQKGTFLVTPYKPLYVTAGRWSSNPNVQPTSENPIIV